MGIRCRPKIWRIGKFRIWPGLPRYEIEQKSIAQKKAILDTKVFGPMDTPPQRPGKPASGRRKSREWEISQTGVLAAAAGRPRGRRLEGRRPCDGPPGNRLLSWGLCDRPEGPPWASGGPLDGRLRGGRSELRLTEWSLCERGDPRDLNRKLLCDRAQLGE